MRSGYQHGPVRPGRLLGWVGASFAAGLIGLHAGVAQACSFAALEPLAIDRQQAAEDAVPPERPQLLEARLTRGTAPVCNGTTCTGTSCDGIGSLLLRFSIPHDESDSVRSIGIRLYAALGDVPAGLVYDGALVPDADGRLPLHFIDDARDGLEPLEFTLVARSVDQAGNESPDSEPIVLSDPGSTRPFLPTGGGLYPAAGCGVTTHGAGAAITAPIGLSAALLFLRSRRKRR